MSSVAEFRKCSLKPKQDIGGRALPKIEEEQQLSTIRVWYDGEWITGIETEWRTGDTAAHGDATGDVTEVSIAKGDYITSVGIRCSNGERNSHINSIMFSTSAGSRSKWIGGNCGSARFLKREGQRVIGFAGRASHYIDALGIITSPSPSEKTAIVAPTRGPVYGGPSGINFSDFNTTDCSQLAPIILRSAFSSTLDNNKQRMLESSRQLFMRLKQVMSTHPHSASIIYSRFEEQFGVKLSPTELEPSPVSPLVSNTRTRLSSLSRSELQEYGLSFDVFSPNFIFNADGSSASCQISAGWRSISCNGAIPLTAGTAVEIHLLVEEIRTLAVGISPEKDSEIQSFVGATADSVAFQSTGHIVNNNSLGEEISAFSRGDTVSLLITKENTTFYVNGLRAATTTTPQSDSLFFTASCHLGPNSVTLLPAYVWSEEKLSKTSDFPPQALF